MCFAAPRHHQQWVPAPIAYLVSLHCWFKTALCIAVQPGNVVMVKGEGAGARAEKWTGCVRAKCGKGRYFLFKTKLKASVISMTPSSFTLMAICAAVRATHSCSLHAALSALAYCAYLGILLLFVWIARSMSTHRDHVVVWGRIVPCGAFNLDTFLFAALPAVGMAWGMRIVRHESDTLTSCPC